MPDAIKPGQRWRCKARLGYDSETLGRVRDVVTTWERSGIGARYAPIALNLLKQALGMED